MIEKDGYISYNDDDRKKAASVNNGLVLILGIAAVLTMAVAVIF